MENYGNQDGSNWILKLPREVTFDILSRLPVLSLLQCKLVSRLWNAAVKHPQLARAHLSHAAEHDLSIVLFSGWPKCKLQLIHQYGPTILAVQTLNLPFLSEFPSFDVAGSCNGLLCLHSKDFIFVYNPFDVGSFHELPNPVRKRKAKVVRAVYGFGLNPKTGEYKLAQIIYYDPLNYHTIGGAPEAFVLTFGGATAAEWKDKGGIDYVIDSPTSEATVEGKLHWVSSNGEIISFDCETEEFRVVPRPCFLAKEAAGLHLVELWGRLSAVAQCFGMVKEIWVMKEYGVEGSWTKQFTVGNYVPRGLRWNRAFPARVRKNGSFGRGFRVLVGLSCGSMVFLYWGRFLVQFDPGNGQFLELDVAGVGLPPAFEPFLHCGSLISFRGL